MEGATTTTAAGTGTAMTTNTNILGAGTTAPTLGKDSKLPTSTAVPTTTVEEQSSSDSDSDPAPIPEVPFTSTQCLFCRLASADMSSNLSHMQKTHGLFIPQSIVIDSVSKVLATDTETLLGYMHLVIFGYRECLFCGTQRRSVQAVQQHMMGRGHCRMNLEGMESEFADFYEDVSEEEDGEGSSRDGSSSDEGSSKERVDVQKIDDNTVRLSSGKHLSHRSAGSPFRPNRRPLAHPKNHRRDHRNDTQLLLEALLNPDSVPINAEPSASSNTTTITAPTDPPQSSSTEQALSLTRVERRALAGGGALTVALSQMTMGDRASLAHLSLAEQRSMIVKQFKQQDKQRHGARKYWSRMEHANNSIRMKHFVSDVPGPKLG